MRGARRRHLAGGERGTRPVRLRASGRSVLIWARNLERGLAYPDRDSGPANHHLCTTDLAGSRHAERRRGAEGSNTREGKTSSKEEYLQDKTRRTSYCTFSSTQR